MPPTQPPLLRPLLAPAARASAAATTAAAPPCATATRCSPISHDGWHGRACALCGARRGGSSTSGHFAASPRRPTAAVSPKSHSLATVRPVLGSAVSSTFSGLRSLWMSSGDRACR
eukprot:359416-Chlamydomonas_euryale.AAC.24